MATKRLTELIADADEREDDEQEPNWSEDGECDNCGRETAVLATTAHGEYDRLCLPCADRVAEDGDLSVLVRGEG